MYQLFLLHNFKDNRTCIPGGRFENLLLVCITTILFCLALWSHFKCFVDSWLVSKIYAFAFGGVLCGIWILVKPNRQAFSISHISLGYMAFIVYYTLLIVLSPFIESNVAIIALISFLLIYLFFKIIPISIRFGIDLIIIILCLCEAVFGLYRCVSIGMPVYGISGHFDNPAGFAMCIACGIPFCCPLLKSDKFVERCFAIISVGVIMFAILLSKSRTGIMASMIVLCWYMIYCFKCHRNAKFEHKYLWMMIFGAVTLMGCIFLFKADSAVGRLFIWMNSLELAYESPVWGHFPGGFLHLYMKEQAEYFGHHADSKYWIFADNVAHPFNEYLLFFVENGIVGLLLLGAILYKVLKLGKSSTYGLAILCVVICACFSYPMRYPFMAVILAYSLAQIETEQVALPYHRIYSIGGKIIIAGYILVGCIILFKDMKFEKQWYVVTMASVEGKPALHNYEALYQNWNGNPYFLYNYGALLNQMAEFGLSADVLNKCQKYFDDYDVRMILDDDYMLMGNYYEAELQYYNAINMCPNRFMPLGCLLKLYIAQKKYGAAYDIAIQILDKPIKIPSATVHRIKREAEEYLTTTILPS